MSVEMGDFELREEVGRGGMGVVYRAWERSLGREVAVKRLPPDLARQRNVAERFRAEAQRMARLAHPYIAKVYAVGEEAGAQFFAMEYLSGGSLEQRLQYGPLTVDEAAAIAIYVAEALDYAHQTGIVHRDIKPANIMFDGTGRVVVTDFGIAKAADDVHLTATGTALGTPEYMAPEQARGNPIDGRADIYALGVVLYEMVCGRPPFVADTPIATAMKHLTEAPPSPRAFQPNVPEWLEAIIGKALAKDPTHRFATAGEMAAALRYVTAAQASATTTVSTAPVTQAVQPAQPRPQETVAMPARRSSAAPWLALAIGLFALVGIGAIVAAGLVGSQKANHRGARNVASGSTQGGSSPRGSMMERGAAKAAEGPGPASRGGGAKAAEPPSSASADADQEQLKQAYWAWLDAWRNKNLDQYMGFYSTSVVVERAGKSPYGYDALRRRMAERWATCGTISIESNDPTITGYDGQEATMTAYQSYGSATWWDKGTKRLVWHRSDGGWRIVRESFHMDDGGGK